MGPGAQGFLIAAVLCLSLWRCGHATRCLQNVSEVNPKRYLISQYEIKRLPITLDVSRRVTHQITTYIFKIFLEEELGYPDVVIKENNDRSSQADQMLQRLMPWKVDSKTRASPNYTLNTEVWMSPEDASLWFYEQNHIMLGGQIGPLARFGWFIPKVLLSKSDVYPYWKTFASPDKAKLFVLAESEMNVLRDYTKDSSGYFCEEKFCNNSMYTPARCNTTNCAVLIAEYADTTEFVVSHIEKLELMVQVVWVGPHLRDVVERLTEMLAPTPRLLVFLSYTPSTLVLPEDEAFTTVAFPPCEDFVRDKGCKYDSHSLVKLYSSIIESGAQPAYDAYLKFYFNHTQYKDLILQYNSALAHTQNSTEAVIQTACKWLQENPSTRRVWKRTNRNKRDLKIGGIFPLNPPQNSAAIENAQSIAKAAEMAVSDVNHNNSLLRDYNLKLIVQDGRCEGDYVLSSSIKFLVSDVYNSLVGILGPGCSNTLEPLVGVTTHYNTTVISYSAEGSTMSDRKKYPYFFRTIGANNQYQQVYLQLLDKLNWRKLAALTEDGQKYTEYLSHLQTLLTSKNYTFVMNRKFPASWDNDAMKGYLKEMKSNSVRIIISDVYDNAAREIMCQAYHLEMTARQSYVWFLPAWLARDWYDTDRYNRERKHENKVPCSTDQMLEAINGHLSLSHVAFAPDEAIVQTGKNVSQWKEDLLHSFNENDRNNSKPLNRTLISSYAGYAYDAVWMYALALDQLFKNDSSALSYIHSENFTKPYVQILEKTDFNGVSGRIQFRNASRISAVEVLQWINKDTHVVGIFKPNVSVSDKDKLAGTLHLNESAIVWLNPDKKKPEDGTVLCFLGLAEYFGVSDCSWFLVIVNGIVIFVIGVIIVIIIFVIKSRYDKKVEKIEEYIGFDLLKNIGTLEEWEIPRDKVVINRKLGEGAFGCVYGGEAKFDTRGWVGVAVKTLKPGSTAEDKLEFLCEAEIMKRFDHKNIVQLLGVCTKHEPVYTVMEFMLYGDLKTFLLARRHLVYEQMEDDSEISSEKLTGMALDIARALSYLAELRYVHRDVASRNCLVNTAMVVKLGDFGMTRSMFDKDYYKFNRRGMLPVRWMSPESLAEGLFTPASDVWSFGVLLYEIITFGSFPFQGLGNNEVLDYVKAGNTLPIPSGIRPQAVGLIRSCWTLDYKKRPMISEIFGFISNHPLLLTPCLDIPLASVQMDGSGSVDVVPSGRSRSFSFSLRNRNGSGRMNNLPLQWGSNSNGFITPKVWSREEPDPKSLGQLYPVGEEDPEWDRPLLRAADKYDRVPTPRAVEFSSLDDSQATSLL